MFHTFLNMLQALKLFCIQILLHTILNKIFLLRTLQLNAALNMFSSVITSAVERWYENPKVSFTRVYLSILLYKLCVCSPRDAQKLQVHSFSQFSSHAGVGTQPTFGTMCLGLCTCTHTAVKLGVVAVFVQPLCPQWHEWYYLHKDAQDTCVCPCGQTQPL